MAIKRRTYDSVFRRLLEKFLQVVFLSVQIVNAQSEISFVHLDALKLSSSRSKFPRFLLHLIFQLGQPEDIVNVNLFENTSLLPLRDVHYCFYYSEEFNRENTSI